MLLRLRQKVTYLYMKTRRSFMPIEIPIRAVNRLRNNRIIETAALPVSSYIYSEYSYCFQPITVIIEWPLYHLMNTSHYLEEPYKMCGPLHVHMSTQAHTAHVVYLVEHGLDGELDLQSLGEHVDVGEDYSDMNDDDI